jgi:hypothetical protein
MNRLRTSLSNLRGRRTATLLITLAALISLFILATGLSGVELMPGDPDAFNWIFRFERPSQTVAPGGERMMEIFRVLYLIGLVLLPIYLIYSIVNPKARKRFIRDMVTLAFFTLFMMVVADYIEKNFQEQEGTELEGFGGMGEMPLGEGDVPAAEEQKPPEVLVWIAGLVVALVIVALGVLIFLIVWYNRKRNDEFVDRIATEMQSAIDELQAGGDIRNVVVRCYSEMIQALKEQRGIQKNASLTPREFEDALKKNGLPLEPVHELTRLFELVRYGHKPISKREELVAIDNLTLIVEACRSTQ